MNGKITKIERINMRGVLAVQFYLFDVSEKDMSLLNDCINSPEDWRIKISPKGRVSLKKSKAIKNRTKPTLDKAKMW